MGPEGDSPLEATRPCLQALSALPTRVNHLVCRSPLLARILKRGTAVTRSHRGCRSRRRRGVDDFDIAQSKIGESAQRVVDRAVEESRRRDHALLTNEHIFLAFAQVEWDTFSQVMRDL